MPHWVHCCPGAAAPTVLSRPPTRRRRLAAFSALALLARAPLRLPPHALPSAHAHHNADAGSRCCVIPLGRAGLLSSADATGFSGKVDHSSAALHG